MISSAADDLLQQLTCNAMVALTATNRYSRDVHLSYLAVYDSLYRKMVNNYCKAVEDA